MQQTEQKKKKRKEKEIQKFPGIQPLLANKIYKIKIASFNQSNTNER